MRLPHPLIASPLFVLEDLDELATALGRRLSEAERNQAQVLIQNGLPPIVSSEALAVMLGVNSGLIWSFSRRPARHYSTFQIPKGQGVRMITAPRVALKVFQQWFAYHLSRAFVAPSHVFGFVPERSYIDAAKRHIGAKWSWSFDIRDFFPSTSRVTVKACFLKLGYSALSSELLTSLTTYGGFLPQGAPTSPVLSNIAFADMDERLVLLSEEIGCSLSRYADDIVLSGQGLPPADLRERMYDLFEDAEWTLEPQKDSLQPLKGRIKIHGLLIKPDEVRLTKGYRNKLRAYKHSLERGLVREEDVPKLKGHLSYAQQIDPKYGLDNTKAGHSRQHSWRYLMEYLKRLISA